MSEATVQLTITFTAHYRVQRNVTRMGNTRSPVVPCRHAMRTRAF